MLRKIGKMTESDKYRNQIHGLIPGGSHTYSKGDDQFPSVAPAAISHGLGTQVWDLDGNQFLDCSMGLTSVSLGHAYEPVLEAVRKEILKGVNFQRPSYLEREMAEKFLSLVPCHQMIKFAKNGSTTTTAAVKLARSFTGRELIAFPGDHPFYSYDDWFIGKTACNKGIPEHIQNMTVTYNSLDLKTLEDLFAKYPQKISCVIAEPEKNHPQPENYIQQLIDICHKHGALYIMDEMVTGFKTDFPGSLKKMNVVPDMTTWGKGIANGFSFCALTGKKEIMELGGIKNTGQEKVFLISSTHGGETHAMAACIATINEFQKHNVIKHNHKTGQQIIDKCIALVLKYNLQNFIEVSNTSWLAAFSFKDSQQALSAEYRTLAMQEMTKNGVLFQGIFAPCFSHTEADVKYFEMAFEHMIQTYKIAIEAKSVSKYLIGEVVKPVFRKIL